MVRRDMRVSSCAPLLRILEHNSIFTPPAQTLANPFANVRDEPEFVEWGYGGMGSVHASAGIASDMWRNLQSSERGGTLLAGSTFGSSSSSAPGKEAKLDARTSGTGKDIGDITVGGGRGSGAHVRSPSTRRRMLSDDVEECGMGSVGAGNGADAEDGSGMGWVKRRRAEREAKARETAERAEKEREGRKSPDSGMDASMSASTMSNSTSLTTSTSTTTTDLETPATSSPASRTTSLTDLSRVPSPVGCSSPSSPAAATEEPSHALPAIPPLAHPMPTPKDELHVRTAVRLSPNLSGVSHKHTNSHSSVHGRAPSLPQSLSQVRRADDEGDAEGDVPLSPVDTVETSSGSSSSGEDGVMVKRDYEDEEEQDDDEEDEAGVSHCHVHDSGED
jgi:hypothetical protein